MAGNVRELRNSVFRAVMLAKNGHVQITASDLKLSQGAQQNTGKSATEP